MSDKMVDELSDKNFDQFLQQNLQNSSHYLDDGDFSMRVMAGLPAPKRLSSWLEKLIVFVPVTLIALLVLNQFPLRVFVQPIYAWVLTFDMSSLINMAVGMLLVMLAIPLSLMIKRGSFF
jgi:hypothetical protein